MTEPQPATLKFSRQADGVQIALLKPPRIRRSPKQLRDVCLGGGLLVLISLLAPLLAVMREPSWLGFTLLFPFFALSCALGMIATELNWLRETAVLEITKGYLTFVRSGVDMPRQWPTSDIATVRAASLGTDWELQIQPKSGAVYRTLRGRSRVELQWTAGLLRAALAPPRAPAAEPVVYVSGGECQVCSSPMDVGIVLCARCRTPHHEECWTYNGVCSTYGCREIRFVRPA
jgi:hypothetical protein